PGRGHYQDSLANRIQAHLVKEKKKLCKKDAEQGITENEEIRSRYQRRFRYILVDEYQDTNGAQYQLTTLLAGGYRNLCVVGDADQSIYGWRGADISNIMNFEQDYPDAKTIMLEQNYRSTKTILAAANAVIENNSHRKKKNLWTDNVQGDKITTYMASDERDEARFITESISKQHDIYKTSYGDIAILYRTNAQSRVLEDAFMRVGLPYTMVGGLKFYDRLEIKDITAYLRVLYNPMDSVSLMRIINVPKRGLGQSTIEKLMVYGVENNLSLFEVIANEELLEQVPGLTARSKNPLKKFAELLFTLMERMDKLAVSDLIQEVMDTTGYLEALKNDKAEKKLENESRIENLQEFVGVAKDFEKEEEEEPNLENFLSKMALLSDIDNSDLEEERVTLMTLHSAKGLEFPVVFMTGMEEGMFPHSRTLMEPEELEEERRTCYVGITRAQRKLYMTYASIRTIFGRTEAHEPSRFLYEFPEELKEELAFRRKREDSFIGFGGNYDGWGSIGGGGIGRNMRPNMSTARPTPKGQPMSGLEALNALRSANPSLAGSVKMGTKSLNRPDMSIQWKVGDKASHSKWGTGTVVKVAGSGEETEIQINFPGIGLKKLMQRYAPLKKV
ncbi:MAG: 3'-5' exonuclease, partial [Anaerovibrio sp.]|nr:3'-5' exonuclease [Anaerovibrio sp.]